MARTPFPEFDPVPDPDPDHPAPADLLPEPGAVVVWLVPVPDDEARLVPWLPALPPDEAARAQAYRHLPSRRRHLAARVAARVLLGRILALPPDRVPLGVGPHGKPRLLLQPPALPEPFDFNLSHTRNLALVAIGRAPALGVDVEADPGLERADRLANRVLHPEELLEYLALPPELRLRAFLRLWTLKEALIKALGRGFTHPPERIRVTLATPPEQPRLLELEPRHGPPERWSLAPVPLPEFPPDFNPDPDPDPDPDPPRLEAALAVEGPPPVLRVRTWIWNPPPADPGLANPDRK